MSNFYKNKKAIDDNLPEELREEIKLLMNEPIDQDLFIDHSNLNEELLDQPLRFKKWSKLEAEASRAAKAAKIEAERVKATVHLQYAKEGGRVSDIEAKVKIDDRVLKASEAQLEAEELHEQYKGFVRALHQKAEALKDLCANKRKELID